MIEYLKKYTRSVRLDDYLLMIKKEDLFPYSVEFEEFLEIIFILFPSNSEVERGFSVNGECLVPNLLEDSLIAQRVVYDSIRHEGDFDLKKLQISTSMIQYFKSACSKRNECLKLKKTEEENDESLKRRVRQELLSLEVKKQKLIESKNEELNMLENNISHLKKALQ